MGDDRSAILALNRAWWDGVVEAHINSESYLTKAFRAGDDTLHPIESEEIGEVSGKSLVHLQCHFGLDTLSLARRGATVTGVDFSPERAEDRAWPRRGNQARCALRREQCL